MPSRSKEEKEQLKPFFTFYLPFVTESGELSYESAPYVRNLSQRAHALARAAGEPSGSLPVITVETKDRHVLVRTVDNMHTSLALISSSDQIHAPLKLSQQHQDNKSGDDSRNISMIAQHQNSETETHSEESVPHDASDQPGRLVHENEDE